MFRDATAADLTALRDLEREANLAALGHVFPPDQYPFPDDAVLARWSLVLDDPETRVLVQDDDGGLVAFVAYDAGWLRHLAVRPDHWGRGVASAAIAAVLAAIGERGGDSASLWCLEQNHRARRLYEHLGWRATQDRQDAAWPPYPAEMRYTRGIDRTR